MNFYNYMLTIQTETMKTAIKKGLEIRCMEDKDNKITTRPKRYDYYEEY